MTKLYRAVPVSIPPKNGDYYHVFLKGGKPARAFYSLIDNWDIKDIDSYLVPVEPIQGELTDEQLNAKIKLHEFEGEMGFAQSAGMKEGLRYASSHYSLLLQAERAEGEERERAAFEAAREMLPRDKYSIVKTKYSSYNDYKNRAK